MTGAEAGVVGPGRVGLSLAASLQRTARFDRVWTSGRGPERPPFLDDFPKVAYASADRAGPMVRPSGEEAGPGSVLLFFAVPDGALEETAARWGEILAAAGVHALRCALHTSGARPGSVLSPLREHVQAPLGSLHPLCAVSRPRAGAFRGVTFGVEGEEEAASVGTEVAEALGGRPVRVRDGAKARYHAAAVFASNFVAACVGEASRQLSGAVEGPTGPEVLVLLAESALRSAARDGLPGGFTGPLVRGDLETVSAHLGALDEEVGELYAHLTLSLARQAGLESERLDELRRLLPTEIGE